MSASKQATLYLIYPSSLSLNLHVFVFLAGSVGELSCVEERLG